MSRAAKSVGIVFVIVSVCAAFYFSIKALTRPGGKSRADDYPWITVDETYTPGNSIEAFIKDDAVAKGLLPVYLRNYGKNAAILKKFRGTNFAGANEAVLAMVFPGLDDWLLLDLRYKNEKERDVARTVLYVQVRGQWKVADSGSLMK